MTDLLKSSRFQGILLIAVLQIFMLFHLISSDQGEGLIRIIQGVIASAIAVRSVDRIGDKKVEAAEIAAVVN